MKARIYKPSKNAMQSGRRNVKDWVLDFEPRFKRTQDPLMGWTSSADTAQQVRLRFATREEALAYCERRNIDVTVREPNERHIKPKSYASNFRWDRAD
ncbi:MAG: ETC complex I subunit [Bauldia litoralis]